MAGNRPLLISGDFNAEPIEPVYSTVINCEPLALSSAYADILASLENSCGDEIKQYREISSDLLDSNIEVQEDLSRVDFLMKKEPPFTTWKIREEGEVCHTIDYVFYSKEKFKVCCMCVFIAIPVIC